MNQKRWWICDSICLIKNETLESLNLYNNLFGIEAIYKIIKLLCKDKKISTIKLGNYCGCDRDNFKLMNEKY